MSSAIMLIVVAPVKFYNVEKHSIYDMESLQAGS